MPEFVIVRSVGFAKASGSQYPYRSLHGDALLAPARGVVNGVFLGFLFWSLIAGAWWAL